MSRRTVLAGAALLPGLARAAEGWAPYGKAVVIDALGGPGEHGTPEDAPFSERAVRDAVDSGVTACNVTVGYTDAWDDTVHGIAATLREVDAHPEALLLAKRFADVRAAKASRRVGLILGTQNLGMIGRDLDKLATLHDLGVRIAQLTYNVRNLLGDGSIEPADAGLSKLGRAAVARVNELRMVLDLAHGGWRTQGEAIAASSWPCAISHTGCAELMRHPRNVPDEVLRALAQRGGVAGIYFMPYLREKGQPHADDVIAHVEHAVSVAGEDHVGIGSDGPLSPLTVTEEVRRAHRQDVENRRKLGIGAPNEDPDVLNYVPELNTPRRLETLALMLSRRGWPDARIEKVLGANFARLFGEVWGS